MIYGILTVLGWIVVLWAFIVICDVFSNKTNESRKLVAATTSAALAILAFVIFSQR